MFNKIKRSFSARVSFYVLLIVFLIFTITIITVTVYTYVEAKRQASEYAMQLLNNNNLEFEKTMGRIEKVPDNLKVYITKQKVPANVLYDITKEVIKNNPDIYGCAIAFEPNYYPEQGYYFAPYSWRNGDSINTRQLGNNDYDYFSMDWYQIPKLLNKNYWSEPYYDDGGGQKAMSTYSSLLYDPKGDFIGIFTADIDISWINKLAAQLKPYEHAATYIIGRSGTFIVHPDSSCVLNESIFSKSLMAGDKKSYKIGQKMMDGESGNDYLIIEGKPYYIFYKSIPSFEWSIAILCPMSEAYAKANTARRTLYLLGLIGLSFLVTIHELGHFLVAKWNNVKVNTFSVGFGKKLLKYKKGETEYCISAIPFGGYVAMAGENPDSFKNGRTPGERDFTGKSVGVRAAIAFAGP
ncbi:MAG: site-2 protease family protein, partial [Bacteroidales bacterium]|nr:site-2 protease family protein [Bacteroidales bacterium]